MTSARLRPPFRVISLASFRARFTVARQQLRQLSTLFVLAVGDDAGKAVIAKGKGAAGTGQVDPPSLRYGATRGRRRRFGSGRRSPYA